MRLTIFPRRGSMRSTAPVPQPSTQTAPAPMPMPHGVAPTLIFRVTRFVFGSMRATVESP